MQVLRTLSWAVQPSCQATKELSVADKILETLTSAIVFKVLIWLEPVIRFEMKARQKAPPGNHF